MKKRPRISSGPESKQDYATEQRFIRAVEKRFGNLHIDLAAHTNNHRLDRWYGPGGEHEDSLNTSWPKDKRLWLNPPFEDITPWASKCRVTGSVLEPTGRIFLLVPASIGSAWFWDHVHGCSWVNILGPRLKYEGADDPFPMDCILAVYGEKPYGYDTWRWR